MRTAKRFRSTILLDIERHLLILVGTVYAVFLIWKWIVALISAIPVYIVSLNPFGFLTLPFYAFTPENKLKARMMRAFESGDLEKGKTLTEEFTKKFNVNVPIESKTEE